MLNTTQFNTATPNTSTSAIVVGAYATSAYDIEISTIFFDSIYDIRMSSVHESTYDILSATMCEGTYNVIVLCVMNNPYNINVREDIESKYDMRVAGSLDGAYSIRAGSTVDGRYDICHTLLSKINAGYNINLEKNIVSQYDLYYITPPGGNIVPGAKAELDKKDWLRTGHVERRAITKEKLAIEQVNVTVETGKKESTATIEEGAMVLGYIPVGNQDQFVDNISISGKILTVSLAAAATTDNTFRITVLNA